LHFPQPLDDDAASRGARERIQARRLIRTVKQDPLPFTAC
jgi:hypothetical protein